MHNVSKFSLLKLANLTFLIAILVIILLFGFTFNSNITYADSYSIIYPTASYYQIQNPTKVVANENYIVIFDNYNNTINIFDMSFNKVLSTEISFLDFDLFIVDNLVIIHSDSDYYSLKIGFENTFSLINNVSLNNISSDGSFIYERMPSGAIYLYDSSLNLKFNDTCDYFTGKDLIMDGNNKVFYIFSHSFQNGNQFIKFDSKSDSTFQIDDNSYININSSFNHIEVLDDVFLCENGNSLFVANIENGNKLFDLNIDYDFYSAFGNRIYTILNNTLNVYTINLSNSSIDLIESISNTGSSINYLNYPTDISLKDNKLLIVDQNNKRLVTLENNIASQLSFDFKPVKMACNGNTMYFVDTNNKIIKIENNIKTVYELTDTIIDIIFFDKLYVLSTNGLYTQIGNDFVKIYNVNNAKSIAYSSEGQIIYLLTNNSIIAINQEGKPIPYVLNDNFDSIIDFDVDSYGNFIIADNNHIYYYLNKIQSLEKKDIYLIENNNFNININSIYLDGKILYISTNESLILQMSIDCIIESEIQNNDLVLTSETTFEYKTFNESTIPYYLPTNFCLNNAVVFTNKPFIVFSAENKINNYMFAIIDNKLVLVDSNCLIDSNIEDDFINSDGYYISDNVNLYFMPFDNSINLKSTTKTIITPVNIIKNINGSDWVKFNLDNQTYYIKSSDLKHLEETTDEQFNFPTAKTKAKRIGSTVQLYATSDFNDVIAKIGDGKEISIIDEFDNFYYVQYRDKFGYIYKEDVQINGLTHLQTLAIILACVVVIISSTIYIMIYFTKHKRNE